MGSDALSIAGPVTHAANSVHPIGAERIDRARLIFMRNLEWRNSAIPGALAKPACPEAETSRDWRTMDQTVRQLQIIGTKQCSTRGHQHSRRDDKDDDLNSESHGILFPQGSQMGLVLLLDVE